MKRKADRAVCAAGESQEWVLTEVSEPEGRIALSSIGCELALVEVYDKVDLPEGGPPLRLIPE